MGTLENNRDAWDRIAAENERWFKSLTPEEINSARAGRWKLKLTPTRDVPVAWYGGDIRDRNVLCLAAGGGQQAPLLAAAGAKVTVLDFSHEQLERDLHAARKFGLNIQTIQADMADLSEFTSDPFDLIINPTSVCYIPEVEPVWQHSFRLLKNGGRFLSGFMLPHNFIFDPLSRDRGTLNVAYSIPYSDLDLPDEVQERLLSPIRPVEFGHSLTHLIGGPLRVGFQLLDFFTDRWGDRDALSDCLDVFGCMLIEKPLSCKKSSH